jgi:TonB family protein
MKRFLFACFISVAAGAVVVAQTPPDKTDNPPDYMGPVNAPASTDRSVPKQISGGVLNGKALSLPKPPYPPAALSVGASGAVSVQVLIDENGDVISANAVSGHPLLRAAAVKAARGARFSPTRLQGTPVKVSGIIVYNFVGLLYPAKLGSVLAHAERSGTFGKYEQAESLADRLPADWVQEKETLNSLTFEEPPVVTEKVEQAKPAVKPAKDDLKKGPPKVGERYTAIGDWNFSAASSPAYATRKLDARSMTALRSVMAMVESRASINPTYAWSYELGQALGILIADIEDRSALAGNVVKIESLADRAPAGVIQMSLERVREFVNFAKVENVTDDVRSEIRIKAESLANMRY